LHGSGGSANAPLVPHTNADKATTVTHNDVESFIPSSSMTTDFPSLVWSQQSVRKFRDHAPNWRNRIALASPCGRSGSGAAVPAAAAKVRFHFIAGIMLRRREPPQRANKRPTALQQKKPIQCSSTRARLRSGHGVGGRALPAA
jgi:hypothetical protein